MSTQSGSLHKISAQQSKIPCSSYSNAKLCIYPSEVLPGQAGDLAPLWKKVEGQDSVVDFSSDNLKNRAELVSSMGETDICFLSMNWTYYLRTHTTQNAIQFAEDARSCNKLVGVWSTSDFERLTPFENAVLFQTGLSRSRKRLARYAFEIPVVVRDSLAEYRNGVLPIHPKLAKPKIGFCGQAAGRLPGLLVWLAQGLRLRGLCLLGRSPEVPPPFEPPWRLRGKVLRLLAQSPLLETDFIIRTRYRAGVRNRQQRNDPLHPTNVEFVNNIFNTDYTVCIRGGGNFSKRLYETLSCGRIPIFIDTDSVLPYDFSIDWKQYCVWVDKSEIPYIAEKVADFHARLSPGDFEDLQRSCRQLWVERLSKEGFLSHFHEHFEFVFQQEKESSA